MKFEDIQEIPENKLPFEMRVSKRRFRTEYIYARDRFNLVSDSYDAIPMPKYTSKTPMELILSTVRKFQNPKILWSGGVDSTLLICAYVHEHLPCSVSCTQDSLDDGREFIEFIKKHDITIDVMPDIFSFYKGTFLTAGRADYTFYSNYDGIRQSLDKRFGSTYSAVPEETLPVLKELASSKFGLDLKTERDYVRFCALAFSYFIATEDITITSNNPDIQSFFDFPEYTDYFYTHFFDSPDTKKTVFREFIADVTGNDSAFDSTKLVKNCTRYNMAFIDVDKAMNVINKKGIYQGKYRYTGTPDLFSRCS